MAEKFTVKQEDKLLNFLFSTLNTWSKKRVKERLKAKYALTHYEVKESRNAKSLLQVHIETGRQHQIRAHMSWLNHAVVGDERYGSDYKKGDTLGLHATKLTIYHPTKKRNITFEVDAPKAFYDLINA